MTAIISSWFAVIQVTLLYASSRPSTVLAVHLRGSPNHTQELIESLPGWSGMLPSAHYSGYIDIPDMYYTDRMHYVFVESEDDCFSDDPRDTPLVLWVQGGPGCSSLMGFFTEMGTFKVAKSSDGSMRLELNPFRWSRCAHMLYWESPLGVGFSYSATRKYATNDTEVAALNLKFLDSWLDEYDEYRPLDFYLAGESYAGIYIPMLAEKIMDLNRERERVFINLRGLLVGNGCIGRDLGACSPKGDLAFNLPYLHNHAMISDVMYDAVLRNCSGQSTPTSEPCYSAINAAYKSVGNINVDDILSPCVPESVATRDHLSSKSESSMLPGRQISAIHGLPGCIFGREMQSYLRSVEVQDALHVVPGQALSPWQACSDAVHAVYSQTEKDVLPIYASLVGDIRIMIYDGDLDANIPFTDNKMWTQEFADKNNLTVTSPWTPWITSEGQVGGYIVKYGNGTFEFATVRGAGHEVPQYQPRAAFDMFRNFLMAGVIRNSGV